MKLISKIKYSRKSLFDLFSGGICKPTEGSIHTWLIDAEYTGQATEKTINRWYKELCYMERGLQDDETYGRTEK